MIKTITGAQRYNNRMDKIFETAEKLKKERYELACFVSDYLLKTGKNEAIVIDNKSSQPIEIMTKQKAEIIIDDYNTQK